MSQRTNEDLFGIIFVGVISSCIIYGCVALKNYCANLEISLAKYRDIREMVLKNSNISPKIDSYMSDNKITHFEYECIAEEFYKIEFEKSKKEIFKYD